MAEAGESMTVYQYAGNDPVMMNDPMGDLAMFPGGRIPVQDYSRGADAGFYEAWHEGDPGWSDAERMFYSMGFGGYSVANDFGATTVYNSSNPSLGQIYNNSQLAGFVKSVGKYGFSMNQLGGYSYQYQTGYDVVDSKTGGITDSGVKLTTGYIKANQGGDDIRWGFPTSPSSINLKKIGDSFYTNVTYEENYYDLRLTKGHLRVMNVDISSLNVMFSEKNRFTGKKISMAGAKTMFAEIFTYARLDLRDRYLDGFITTQSEAANFLIQRINGLLNGWFTYGLASERTPSRWIGPAKTNLIYLFP